MYRANRLSKEDCQYVTKKATAKVSEAGGGRPGKEFLDSKRKLKVRLSQHRADAVVQGH